MSDLLYTDFADLVQIKERIEGAMEEIKAGDTIGSKDYRQGQLDAMADTIDLIESIIG